MIMRKSNSIFQIFNSVLVDLPTPSNINYMWNFGSLLGICLVFQILSGLVLSFHFSSDSSLVFNYVSYIMRDVNYGWFFRLAHANGASMFFILIYLHMGRGLYFDSFKYGMVWGSGIIILLSLMGIAFLGYVLPWGQMSFWGVTVITNLISAIPYVGESMTYWIWGGFSVSNATLTRFYSLHFIGPLFLLVLVCFHIMFLHNLGSSNPIGTPLNLDSVNFHPYFLWSDLLGLMWYLFIYMFMILAAPNFFADSENFIEANLLVTPVHIQPEWYFLFAYAILRSIPSKLGGVIGLLMSILMLGSLIFSVRCVFNYPIYFFYNYMLFWYFCLSFIVLTYLGMCPVEIPYVVVSQIFTFIYFSYFVLKPLLMK